MKFDENKPPREFEVGRPAHRIRMKDFGRMALSADEQITFVTEDGGEYDVARKSWGFYATPSLNGRVPRLGFRPALAKSPGQLYYVFLVEKGKEPAFQQYLSDEGHQLICWLDEQAELERLEAAFKESPHAG
jgi:hypothetical protein